VNGRSLDDRRVRIVVDDARARLLASADRYDVITSQPSNPWVAGVSNCSPSSSTVWCAPG